MEYAKEGNIMPDDGNTNGSGYGSGPRQCCR